MSDRLQKVLSDRPDRYLIPSLMESADGTPRFYIPVPKEVLSDLNKADQGLAYLTARELVEGCEMAGRLAMCQITETGDAFIDIGAHVGLFSLSVATAGIADVEYLAVEAHPANAAHLMESLAVNGLSSQIPVLAAAMGGKTGIQPLYGGAGSMGHSLIDAGADTTECLVPVMPLDMVIGDDSRFANRPLVVKIDVEGVETAVIAGMASLLDANRVKALLLERGESHETPVGLSAFNAMIDQLKIRGFSLWMQTNKAVDYRLVPYDYQGGHRDIIALAKGFEPASFGLPVG